MPLEAFLRKRLMEDRLERRILERGAVNVTGDPVVIEYGGTLVDVR